MTTETKRTPEEQVQYDAMIQQFLGDAQAVQGDPGAVSAVYTPDVPLTGPLGDTEAVTAVVDAAGAAWVWHTQTYKASRVNRNMLPDQLRKKGENGKLLFTVYGPEDDRSPIKGMYPTVGIHKCLLHPDGEHRTYYDTLGLPVCSKSTIPSPFQVTQHMRIKHEQEWNSIEQQRTEAEKADDRKFQRELLGMAATGNAPVAPASGAPSTEWVERPAIVMPKPDDVATTTTTDATGGTWTSTIGNEPVEAKRHGPKAKKKRKQQMLACTACNLELEAGSTLAVRARLTKHMKEEHPDG